MVRHAAAVVFVLFAAACAPRICAASQQSDELKQIKADIKLALAQAKTGTDAALSLFADNIDIILTKIANGTQSLTALPDDLGGAVLTAVDAIEDANRDAVNDTSALIATHSTVPVANVTLPGGGGDFDKFQASLNALMSKAFKKMQGTLKKVQKTAAKTSSTPLALNILLYPFQPAENISSDHDSSAAPGSSQNSTVAILIGTSLGHAFIGGLANGFSKTDVFDGTTHTEELSVAGIWSHKKTGLTPGNNFVYSITTTNLEAFMGQCSIGIPTAP